MPVSVETPSSKIYHNKFSEPGRRVPALVPASGGNTLWEFGAIGKMLVTVHLPFSSCSVLATRKSLKRCWCGAAL